MKRKIYLVLFFGAMMALGSYAYAMDLFGAKGAQQSKDPTLQQMLTYAIQDEYLAHAEYEYIINKFGPVRPFSNIIKAEENHISMLKPLFEKYGFQVPKNTAKEHILIPKDLKEALETGVQAEIDNIGMYNILLNKQLPEDVRNIFERLKNASGNHLRAFRNGLRRY